MLLPVVLVGLLIAMIGAVGAVRPKVISAAILGLQPRARWHIAIAVRVLFGVVLLLGAPDSRFPDALYILGGIVIAAAVVLAVIGAARTDVLVRWVLAKPQIVIRSGLIGGLLFGVFLMYAGF